MGPQARRDAWVLRGLLCEMMANRGTGIVGVVILYGINSFATVVASCEYALGLCFMTTFPSMYSVSVFFLISPLPIPGTKTYANPYATFTYSVRFLSFILVSLLIPPSPCFLGGT